MARKPRLTQRRIKAAVAAIDAMLSGEDNAGDWPEDVTRQDLEGAAQALHARLDGTEDEGEDHGTKPATVGT